MIDFINFLFIVFLFGIWGFAMYKSGQDSVKQDPSDNEDLNDNEDEA